MTREELQIYSIQRAKAQETPNNDDGVFQSIVDTYRYSYGPINGEIEWFALEVVIDEIVDEVSGEDREKIEEVAGGSLEDILFSHITNEAEKVAREESR